MTYKKSRSLRQSLIILILTIVSSVSIITNFIFYTKLQHQYLVTEVVDGDSFQLKSGKRVRLIGVSAPEYDRCGGSEAKQLLEQLILNKIVILKEEHTEAFGRSLALVYYNDQLINEIILKKGWGRPDYQKNSARDRLTAAFHYAQKKQLGIFSPLCRQTDDNSAIQENCNIKGNIDKATYQKFYHLPGCKHYNQVIIEKDIGEQFFCNEQEAIAAGFTKATACP